MFKGDFNNFCNNVGGMGYAYSVSARATYSKSGGHVVGYTGEYKNGECIGFFDTNKITSSGTIKTTERTVTAGTTVYFSVTMGGCKATLDNMKITVRRIDTAKPAVKSAAPLATTAYKKGDEAYITIIYNEPINTISGTPTLEFRYAKSAYVKYDSKLAQYFENPVYVNNGTGTNSLVFKVTAKKDISADEIQNTINTYLAFPVSGVGGDFGSNIGTVSATVKDILGN